MAFNRDHKSRCDRMNERNWILAVLFISKRDSQGYALGSGVVLQNVGEQYCCKPAVVWVCG